MSHFFQIYQKLVSLDCSSTLHADFAWTTKARCVGAHPLWHSEPAINPIKLEYAPDQLDGRISSTASSCKQLGHTSSPRRSVRTPQFTADERFGLGLGFGDL